MVKEYRYILFDTREFVPHDYVRILLIRSKSMTVLYVVIK